MRDGVCDCKKVSEVGAEDAEGEENFAETRGFELQAQARQLAESLEKE